MRYLVLCAMVLLLTGCNEEFVSDANSIGEGMVEIAPVVAPFNPAWSAGIAAVGTIIVGVAGVWTRNRIKKRRNK